MPKSKVSKKRKNKAIAYSNNLKARRKKLQKDFMSQLQESHKTEMESKVNATKDDDENTTEDLNEFSLDNPDTKVVTDSNELSEFSLEDLPQVEQSAPHPDSVSGVYSKPPKNNPPKL